MKLIDILTPENINISLNASSKSEVIKELVNSFHLQDIPGEKIINALMEREKIHSTGVGNGVAIPHARIDGIDDFHAVIGISPGGVDFNSMDGKPVNLFFVLLSPQGKQNGTHIELLADIARIAQSKSIVSKLLNARSNKEVFDIIKEASD